MLVERIVKLLILWQSPRYFGTADFHAKALLLVIPTELEIFRQDFLSKTLLLGIPSEQEIFCKISMQKAYFWSFRQNILISPSFGESYTSRNSLAKAVL